MIHLGSIGKTPVDVDVSFLFVAALWVANEYQNEKDLKVALLWAPVLLISVLLHELAHAGMIAAFGYGSSQIVLSGMGGVTYNRRHARPWHDLVISVAGPASSFLLAFVAYYLYIYGKPLPDPADHAGFNDLLGTVNGFFGLFLDEQWGLLIYAPIYLLALMTLAGFWRARRPEIDVADPIQKTGGLVILKGTKAHDLHRVAEAARPPALEPARGPVP